MYLTGLNKLTYLLVKTFGYRFASEKTNLILFNQKKQKKKCLNQHWQLLNQKQKSNKNSRGNFRLKSHLPPSHPTKITSSPRINIIKTYFLRSSNQYSIKDTSSLHSL